MTRPAAILLPLLVGACISPVDAQNPPFSLTESLNLLIGSNGGGNVFAGATLPYGMAKAVADVSGQNTGGFSTDGSNVTGFSSMHDSGTGGNPSLGNFPLFPMLCPGDDLGACRFPKYQRAVDYDPDSVVARPGYFALRLANGIAAEMTVSQRAALYRFAFPEAPPPGGDGGAAPHPLILLDLDDLWRSRQNASIEIDPGTGRMTGSGTFLPSFGAGSYALYFCADVGGATVFDSGVYVNDRAGTEPQRLFVTRGFNLFYLQAGGFVRLERPADGVVSVRMGVSFVSTEQACANAEREIPGPEYDFDGLVVEAEAQWTQKLSPVSVTPGGASKDMQVTFWSGLYRNMISPQNYTGENPLWQSSEPYYDSFYW